MGRPKLDKTTLTIYISPKTANAVRERLRSPYSTQVQHGAMSGLIEQLLRQWLRGEIDVELQLTQEIDDELKLSNLIEDEK